MEIFIFITLTQHKSILTTLNHCQRYLQVITLSDITAPNGQFIFQGIKEGHIQDHTFTLKWLNKKEHLTTCKRLEAVVPILKFLVGNI